MVRILLIDSWREDELYYRDSRENPGDRVG